MAKKKNEKELRHRFGKLAESMETYCHHIDLRPVDNLTDDVFTFIMKKVRGVNMLDLNETGITNESIRLLTHLEYVYELRARDCVMLDDGCVGFLQKIKSLRFLQLNSTSITLDGLLQLSDLPHLAELHFSVPRTEDISKEMLQLKKRLPFCRFVVNSKPWVFADANLYGDIH